MCCNATVTITVALALIVFEGYLDHDCCSLVVGESRPLVPKERPCEVYIGFEGGRIGAYSTRKLVGVKEAGVSGSIFPLNVR